MSDREASRSATRGSRDPADRRLSAEQRRELIASMRPEDAAAGTRARTRSTCPTSSRSRSKPRWPSYPEVRSASIPALWAVQRHYGWCTPEGIRQAAAVMGVTPAYLESVASFYDLFRTSPVGRHRVLVCHNISCWMRGADELLDAFCEAAGVDPHEADHGGASSADGEVYLKGFECLGACDIAPMASIDERYYGPLTPDDAPTAVEQLRAGADPMPDKALSAAERPAAPSPSRTPVLTEGRGRRG